MRVPFKHLVLMLVAVIALASCRSTGEFGSEADQLVDNSRLSFQSLMKDDQYPALVTLASRAKAIIIFPNMAQGAFFFGGRGGNGVMLSRDDNGHWSNPAVYTLGGLSFGLQFGAQSSELVVTVMTQKGLDAIMDREVTLGANAGVAVGELGKGVSAATAIGMKSDLYTFARSQGLFVGVSLEGAVISPRETWNQELYGHEVTPKAILVDRTETSSSLAVNNLVSAMP